MNSTNLSLEELRRAVELGSIEWQKHCLQRMVEREVSRQEVIEAIQKGEKIEDYPKDWPLPSSLIFFGGSNQRPLHVVVAFHAELKKALIITVYQPDLVHFESDLKTRRKKK